MDMYNARYKSDSGKEFLFSFENGVIFDIDPLSGVTLNLATAQGYHNAGETVTGKTVGGVTRKISGVFFREQTKNKRELQSAFAPFSSGRLYFNEKYYCECDVKKTPEFYVKNGREMFSLQIHCAYPYWVADRDAAYSLGAYEPAFMFPVNYANPHRFGVKDPNKFVDVFNDGEESAQFTAEFTTTAQTVNYGFMNIHTGAFIRFTDTLEIGERMRVWWKNNVLQVEKTDAEGVKTDAFPMLDENSTLLNVAPGNNVFLLQAESGLEAMIANVAFKKTRAGVYDGIE